jgi:YVTN family beta-propeller protein
MMENVPFGRAYTFFLFASIPMLAGLPAAQNFSAPAGNRPALRRNGASILPGGRIIAPIGQEFPTGPGAFGVAFSPSGKTIVTANGGPVRYSLTILERDRDGHWSVRQLLARGNDALDQFDTSDWRGVSNGVAFASEHSLFVSEGNSGRIGIIDSGEGAFAARRRSIELNQNGYSDSYSGDLTYDSERGILYAADQANFRVAAIDARSRQILASVRVGRLPFALTLSPDRRKLYVANVGMFQYRLLPGVDPNRMRETGRPFPPFGFPGAEALASLGDPNAPESNSIAVVDVADPSRPKVETYIRTGTPVGEESAGGSSPSGVLAAAGSVFVSNATDDSVSIINASTNRVEAEIPIRIPGLENLRGVLPIGLAYHEQRGWLFVAEAGINAVGVIDVRQRRVLGHIPAAWFPTRVAVQGDMLFVANAKGHGAGPDAPAYLSIPAAAIPGYLYQGTLSAFDLPAAANLAADTAVVMEANGFVPRPLPAASVPDAIRHVVLIVKESRSYDEVLGDVSGAMGAPALARYGSRGFADGRRQVLSLKDVDITPNHHAIARQWTMADNFYSDAEGSVDGHHWLTGSYPNAWTQSSLQAAYGEQKDFRVSAAPGRLSFPGNAASVTPEDLNQGGTLWRHLARHGVSFLNFGEGFELAGVAEGTDMEPAGARFSTNMPMPEALYPSTSRNYPGFNLHVSDVTRAKRFIQDIDEKYVRRAAEFPSFVYIHLPGDYGAAPNAEAGYPYDGSYIAANDYALGLIVEYLSASRWWSRMAVFVTEDDAQGGVDHVDAHRTILLCAGPWFRKGYVAHMNTSYPGLLKTIFRLLRAPALNLFDAAASDLAGVFAGPPDPAPYHVRTVDPRLFRAIGQ